MELAWNLCPYCGTPTPGMRRENISLNEALQSLAPAPLEELEGADLEEPVEEFEFLDIPDEETAPEEEIQNE